MPLRIDPALPLVWRTPSSLQFGVHRVVAVLDDVTPGEERLVAALQVGLTPSGYAMLAESLDVARADELLRRMAPALVSGGGEAGVAGTAARRRIAVFGEGPLAAMTAGVIGSFARLDVPAAADAPTAPARPGSSRDGAQRGGPPLAAAPPHLVVLVGAWLVPPTEAGRWLRRDVPHLPVIVGDQGVQLGPIVEPGRGPCLYCLQLHATDRDPAWPAITAQLLDRPAPPLDAVTAHQAAGLAGRLVRERLDAHRAVPARSVTIEGRTGALSARSWTTHPDCRCAAHPGSDWAADVDRADPHATSSAPAADVPG